MLELLGIKLFLFGQHVLLCGLPTQETNAQMTEQGFDSINSSGISAQTYNFKKKNDNNIQIGKKWETIFISVFSWRLSGNREERVNKIGDAILQFLPSNSFWLFLFWDHYIFFLQEPSEMVSAPHHLQITLQLQCVGITTHT